MSSFWSFIKRVWFDFIANVIAPSIFLPRQLRYMLYKLAGLDIHSDNIRPNVYFHAKCVRIGKGSFINSFSKIFSSLYNGGFVTIGENCYLAMGVSLITHSHDIGDESQRCGKLTWHTIVIKDGCWLGANVTVLPGVTIEKGCVIAAGSVVKKDCEANGLYAGVPAKRIKDLD